MANSAGAEKNYKVGMLLDFYGELLSARQRDILDLYYNDDLSLSEVSEECGITRQGVRDAIVKGEKQLLDFENRLGLLEKSEKNKETLKKMQVEFSKLEEKGIDIAPIKELAKELLF